MEGPLVSDTTELLSGAPGASEGAPVGTSAPSAASGASAPKSRGRGGSGGTGLSSLLMPELQRIAHSMSIPGAGRMRKGQLIEAIEARQGGAPRPEAGAAHQGPDQRVASAGAGPARLRKQDAAEPGTRTQPGPGDGAVTDTGSAARGGISADGAAEPGQQLSFDQAPAADRPNGRSRRAATPRTSARQAAAPEAPAEQAPAEHGTAPQAVQEAAAAPPGAREDGQTSLRDEAATGEAQ